MAIQLDCILHITFNYKQRPLLLPLPLPRHSPVIGGLRKVVNGKAK